MAWNVVYSGTAPSALMLDWLARSQGAGVVWAQVFQVQNDVTKYIVHGGASLATLIPTYIQLNSSDSILGGSYGSLQLNTLANQGYPNGAGSWNKPFAPIAGVDINNAGVATISDFTQIQDSGVWGNTSLGGFFSKYADPGVIGTEFWLQWRMKFSASRFASGVPYGKFFFVTLNNSSTPTQEIVLDADPRYGGDQTGYVWMYSNGGNAFNSFLGNPQDGGSGKTPDAFQPASPFAATCKVGSALGASNCVVYPKAAWFTMMLHIKPGSQNVTNNSPGSGQNTWTANPSNPNDTLIELFIAPQGQTTWTTAFSHSGQQIQFDSTGLARGYNIMSCQYFTGGGSEQLSPVSFTHQYDQIILSTQAIPCPQV